jgi:hypothetical protein
MAEIEAIHSVYGNLTFRQVVDFGGNYRPLMSSDNEWLLSAFGGAITIFVMLSFGRRHAKVGIFAAVATMAVLFNWGWFESSPYLSGGVIVLLAFIAVASVLTRRGGSQ